MTSRKSTPPGTKPRPPSTPRGGFICLRRDADTHRLIGSRSPYEHATAADAVAEARALAAKHQAEFAVFHEIGATETPKRSA